MPLNPANVKSFTCKALGGVGPILRFEAYRHVHGLSRLCQRKSPSKELVSSVCPWKTYWGPLSKKASWASSYEVPRCSQWAMGPVLRRPSGSLRSRQSWNPGTAATRWVSCLLWRTFTRGSVARRLPDFRSGFAVPPLFVLDCWFERTYGISGIVYPFLSIEKRKIIRMP